MYSYTRKNKKLRRNLTISLLGVLAIAVGTLTYLSSQTPTEDIPVSKEEVHVPVISLPETKEKAIKPFKVEANIVLDYYDGSDTEVASMTKFEGTYRANQGIDYAYNNEAFDVLAIFSGEVTDVKEDPLFGHSVTIKSDHLMITYQSLKDMKKSIGDTIAQGDALSLASSNVYNKDLENHVHIVVEKNGERIDPEEIYGKTLEELK